MFRILIQTVPMVVLCACGRAGSLQGSPLAQEGERPSPITLDGSSLTLEQLFLVARRNAPVTLDEGAMERVGMTHALLMEAANQGCPIYGLTRGVGENKDRPVNGVDLEASRAFNRRLLHSHAAAVGPDLDQDLVRAALLARLNTLLLGNAGVQPAVVRMYRDLLNHGIHPVIPSRGSVGEADITLLPHVGLAMMGEWQVDHDGRRMPAAEALKSAGIEALDPVGKDALSIVSSNSVSAGMAALLLHDAEELLAAADLVFAASLEGLNGNVAPLLPIVQDARPYRWQQETAAGIRESLAGSYLWSRDPDKKFPGVSARALQDPLCFRTASQVHGKCHQELAELREFVQLQLNSSDDNPSVILGPPPSNLAAEVAWVGGNDEVYGAVVPSANFEPLTWALGFEALGTALAHVSRSSCYRMIKLGTSHFTGLRRFLAPDDTSIAFSTIEKAFTSLDTENRALSRPISTDFIGLAGGIEDHATNAPIVMRRVSEIVDNLRYILGMELMYAAQAVDLRRQQITEPEATPLRLGSGTSALLERFREVLPFLDEDRMLTPDILTAYEFVRAGSVTAAPDSGR